MRDASEARDEFHELITSSLPEKVPENESNALYYYTSKVTQRRSIQTIEPLHLRLPLIPFSRVCSLQRLISGF
jgi:hypothetical protein